jgi:Ca2+/Na+ antiporter
VQLARGTLLLEGLFGVCVTCVGVAVLLGWLAPVAAAILVACIVVPYLFIVIGGSERAAHARPAGRLHPTLEHARGQHPRLRPQTSKAQDPTRHLLALIVLDVALIVAASAGMVQAALALGARWHVSDAVLGMLVLAPLTSIPNAVTAMRLALAGRGAALVGETFNSNTINLAVGVVVPSLFVTLSAPSPAARLQLGWLVGMTCAGAQAWCAQRGGGDDDRPLRRLRGDSAGVRRSDRAIASYSQGSSPRRSIVF